MITDSIRSETSDSSSPRLETVDSSADNGNDSTPTHHRRQTARRRKAPPPILGPAANPEAVAETPAVAAILDPEWHEGGRRFVKRLPPSRLFCNACGNRQNQSFRRILRCLLPCLGRQRHRRSGGKPDTFAPFMRDRSQGAFRGNRTNLCHHQARRRAAPSPARSSPATRSAD